MSDKSAIEWTKRAKRMREYLSNVKRMHAAQMRIFEFTVSRGLSVAIPEWPFPNVWLGVSAERQQEADERIPLLLRTPAAVRFVSCEPLLGPIDLTQIWALMPSGGRSLWNALKGADLDSVPDQSKLDWVIGGGESGSDRPSHVDWFRKLRDDCTAAGTAFFFKQWGDWLSGESNHGQFDPRPMHAYRRCDNHSYEWPRDSGADNFGTHPDKWSGPIGARRVGKKAAGRLLDCREWNEFPKSGAEQTRVA